MSVVQEHEDTEPPSADSVVARLDEILQELAGAVLDSSLVSDAARIDRIARLEKLRAVTAALQGRRVGAVRPIPGGGADRR